MQKIDFKKLKDEIASILKKTEKEKRVMQLNRILADKENIKKTSFNGKYFADGVL